MTRRELQALEHLTADLAVSRPSDASLAVLKRLLAALGRRRRLRREILVLHAVIIGANIAAGSRMFLGVSDGARAHVLAGWFAVLALSVVAFLRIAAIRSRVRSLSARVDELAALLRWLYR